MDEGILEVSELAGDRVVESMNSMLLGSEPVSGKKSWEVTKVTLTELRKLFVMESKIVGIHGEKKKDWKKTVKCGEKK